MILIKAAPYNLPSYEALNEFEESFPESINIKYSIKNLLIKKTVQKILELYPEFFTYFSIEKNTETVFAILMGTDDLYRLIPFCLQSKKVSLYIYDLWEYQYDFFKNVLEKLNIDSVFLSSAQTTELLKKKCSDLKTKFYWLPEAIKMDLYKFYPYENKSTDLLSFGRRFEKYHQNIIEYIENNGINYIYQKDKLIFSNINDFVEGLAKAKISVCFPASITHPHLAGNISKVTMRYFQSMACKCLVLGKTPDDMHKLFDYNPVIEIDENNPCGQVQEILDNYEQYIPLIEKNYSELINKHQYINRANSVIEFLSEKL
jgi:hypothetical protein